jgi:hypothetical protein
VFAGPRRWHSGCILTVIRLALERNQTNEISYQVSLPEIWT